MQRLWFGLGSVSGLIAVAMAAVGAHALAALPPAGTQMLHSAVEMQAWHALALLACGLWAPRGGRLADGAGAAFALGTLLFCGALYALVLADMRLPMAAPTGGTLLMLGWALLGVSALRAR
jgi:uncharacterized membrane protein YgdD (TMEM256/DUF423 family)